MAGTKKSSPSRRDETVSLNTNSIKEKKMRKALCVSVLVLVLCGSALAGDISISPAPTPPRKSIPYTPFGAKEPSPVPGAKKGGEPQPAGPPPPYLFAEAALTVLD